MHCNSAVDVFLPGNRISYSQCLRIPTAEEKIQPRTCEKSPPVQRPGRFQASRKILTFYIIIPNLE